MNPAALDTWALPWLVAGSRHLSSAAATAIERAGEAIVSAISLTEIHRLLRRRQIELRAEMLPWHHRDAADRFILATAACRKTR